MTTQVDVGMAPFNSLKRAALLAIGAGALFFTYEFVLQYFTWNQQSYGYYWSFRLPLIVHVIGGLLALLTGLFQLWTGLGGTNMQVHRMTGKIYLTGVVIGATGALVFSSKRRKYHDPRTLRFTSEKKAPAYGINA